MIFESDNSTKGCMYIPMILGSDKTTVSVATGNVKYHPLYLQIGNLHGSVRRAHRGGVIPIGFLAIPKGKVSYCVYAATVSKFVPQLIANLTTILPSAPSRSNSSTTQLLQFFSQRVPQCPPQSFVCARMDIIVE